MKDTDKTIITKSRLVNDLAKLGVLLGQLSMLPASVKAIGWIVGDPDIVLQAILDLLTRRVKGRSHAS
jgi:aminoglycoside 3-N-acetyltransferase